MAKQLTVESIKSDIETLDRKIERMNQQLDKATQERDALETVLKLYSASPRRQARRHRSLNIDPEEIRGLSTEEALVRIAESGEGELNSTIARRILEDVGILSGENTQNDLWTILKSSKRFKKLEGRGRYRLISFNRSQPL